MRPLVCLLLMLAMAFSFSVIRSAAVDTQWTPSGVAKDAKTPCCKHCICQASVVAECQCRDIKAYCGKYCKSCRCTKSIPPQCQCMDYHRDDCYPPACRS